ncbi:ABC transporter ATP-binding protein [Dethiosulfatarculus sandiegensis]|uniref:Nickel import system ATP-binding protein NikD n=1 Tax=Dethiosulfatarculus sandiegensis TaxID=1429043 RepID=A0A0D2J7G3_9BACT|nr:ABC transporter ATP-binding protein [Dethiosulfatarculus sandiegensis]KIX11656.1 ABC transporter [Dethiosulfatarculus sandiegensis]
MSLLVKKLSVSYEDNGHALQALECVDFVAQKGRITALVGESGSGKTTLGKACMGLLPKNATVEGGITLGDKPLLGMTEEDLNKVRWSELAMVFQNGAANFNPVYTILDQVAEPLIQHRDMPKPQALELAGQALLEMGLKPEEHTRYPHQLSGGQVQRALLAMAQILDPGVLILDEPTASLDAMSKGFVSRAMVQNKEKGKAIFLITHDLELASQLADDLYVLYLGQVMEKMAGSELFSEPRHPYSLALARSFPSMETARDLGGIRGDAFYRLLHQHGHRNGTPHRHAHIASSEAGHEPGHAPPSGCLFHDRCTQAREDCRKGLVPLTGSNGRKVRCLRGGIVDLLDLKGIAHSYDDQKALQPTDLTLKAGEIFCLVGETGSGKTTLAMAAAGALQPKEGKRIFQDRDMDEWLKTDRRALARKVGLVYQNPAESVSHRLNVAEIVAEPLRIQHLDQDSVKVQELVKKNLSEVHLSTDQSFLKRYPHELNMGAIQRVCLARALVLNPSFLVADEPTSSLDPSVQAKVMKLLLDLQINRGITMLFVTHDIGLARKVGDRMGVMLNGRMVESGPAWQVIAHPAHPYTRMLIQSASAWQGMADPHLGEETGDAGCAFALRCPHSTDVCFNQDPGLRQSGPRRVLCHIPLTDENNEINWEVI